MPLRCSTERGQGRRGITGGLLVKEVTTSGAPVWSQGLAVVAAVNNFDAYLVTHPFSIETDHRALMFLNSAKHNNGRLARWAIQLQPYTFHIRYRLGKENDNADGCTKRRRIFPYRGLRPTTAGGRCHAAACLTWSQRRQERESEDKRKAKREERENC